MRRHITIPALLFSVAPERPLLFVLQVLECPPPNLRLKRRRGMMLFTPPMVAMGLFLEAEQVRDAHCNPGRKWRTFCVRIAQLIV